MNRLARICLLMGCFIFPLLLSGQSGNSGSGHCSLKVESLVAEDTRTEAGKRTSTTKLLMVQDESPRTASLVITTSGEKKNSCPYWAGVKAPNGATSASWIENIDKRVIMVSACGGGKAVEIGTERHYKISADLSKFHEHVTWLENKINGFFIENHVPNQIKFGGNLKGTLENVDMFNNGNTLGVKLDLAGTFSGSYKEVKISTGDMPLPPPVSLCYLRADIIFGGATGSISGNVVFNQSKEDPWEKLESEVKFSSEISLGGAVGVGNANFIALEASVTGSTTTYASGSALSKEKSIYLKSKLGAGEIKAKGDVKFRAVSNLKIVIASLETTVLKGFEGEQEVLIYTIP